jgi:aminoglycoside phosphotransferase (APT) family kinase protein
MYAPADPARIVAVIDWEMCTIGDPLCDVGLLCVYWADDESEAAARTLHGRAITVEKGFYKRADILRDYAAGTQRDMSALDWYVALGAYKLAIIAEGITARFLMGMTVGEGFETMGDMVPAIVEGGLDALARLGSNGGD